MKWQIPFTDYDFWAYLSAGFVLFVAVDQAFSIGWMLGHEWKLAEGLFVIVCAYVTGHIIAGFSSALIERRLVRHWVGKPVSILMGEHHGPRIARFFYPVYFETLPAETQQAIRTKAAAVGVHRGGEALYWCAFNVVKKQEVAYGRMTTFLNLYGLCRNLCMALLISSALLLVEGVRFDDRQNLIWAAVAAFLSVGMLFRYLKFYRHYCVEVLTTYASEV